MKNERIKNIINLIILFLCTEIVKIFLAEIPEFKNFDIRIIFVLIISSSLGMKYGIVSAILASVSYLFQEYGQVNDIRVIFLNTNNWIPIVIYIVFSIIVGLKKDKDMIKILNLENELKQSKVNEQGNNEKIVKYENEIKELNRILMVHNQSYIQAAQFMNDLKANEGDIAKINIILRKILNNNSCELLPLSKMNSTIVSIVESKKVQKEKIWINIKLDENLPFYIVPICVSNLETMAIVIWKCDMLQMNIEYQNQIIGIAEIIKFLGK